MPLSDTVSFEDAGQEVFADVRMVLRSANQMSRTFHDVFGGVYTFPPAPNPFPRARLVNGEVVTRSVREIDVTDEPYMEPLFQADGFRNLMQDNAYSNPICKFFSHMSYKAITDKVNYIALDGDKISYMPKGRIQEEWPDGTWKEAGRQSGKPARIARMLIPKARIETFYSDAHFEEFANIVKASNVTSNATFELVSGMDIQEWYDEDRYMQNTVSSLTNSCMRYYKCRRYFDIYTKNSDIVSMLMLKDKTWNKIHGRAIVWKVPGFDTLIMDRVYGSDTVQQAFRDHAIKSGWIYRAYNSFENETTFIHNNEVIYLDICIKLPKYKFAAFPYLDTMKFFDRKEGTISNRVRYKSAEKTRYITSLVSTRGDGAWDYWDELNPSEPEAQSFVKTMKRPYESYADEFAPNDDYYDDDAYDDDDDEDDENWPVPEDV